MKCELIIFQHSENGLGLYMIPETDVERNLLRGLWKHGELESNNGLADGSGQGFSVCWRVGDKQCQNK